MKKLLTGLLILGWAATASAFTYENPPGAGSFGSYTGGNTFTNISVIGSAYIKNSGSAARVRLYHDGAMGQIQTATGGIHIDPYLNLLAGSSAIPSLNFGDGDSGWYEAGDDNINLSLGGVIKFGVTNKGKTLLSPVLDEATGIETALTLNYTVNKATSGAGNGLLINMIDTLSPDANNILLRGQVDGADVYRIYDDGDFYATSGARQLHFETSGMSISGQGAAALTLMHKTGNQSIEIYSNINFSVADNGIELGRSGGANTTHSTGHFNNVALFSNYLSTGDSSATDLLINRTETSVGSGEQLLFDTQVGGASKFKIDHEGSANIGGAPIFSGWSTITADYSVDSDIFFIECDAALGNISTTLPPIAGVPKGRMIEVKLTSATNGCYIDGSGVETIDGVAGKEITAQWKTIALIAAAAQWFVK